MPTAYYQNISIVTGQFVAILTTGNYINILHSADRTMPSQDVRTSVRRLYSVETVTHILKLFTPLASYTILGFAYQMI